MSRVRNYFHAIWSGSLLTVITALLNLVTMPIAVSALGKSGYGLWCAVTQLAIFTSVFDFGIGASVGRFFADYKEHTDRRAYGGFLKSLIFVGALQGLLFVVAMLGLISFLPGLMNIPAEQAHQFKTLAMLQLAISALSFPLRPLTQLLFANQQIAPQNACYIIATILNGVVIVAALHFGWGAYSYIAANWTAFAVTQGGIIFFVFKLRLLPPMRAAKISLGSLRPLARFSSNVFLTTIGGHLIAVAPGLLITRKLGLPALADWTAGTRLVMFVVQLIARVPNSSEPVFWEMFARGETERVRRRLLEVVLMSASAVALLGGGLVATNAPFITFWMSGRVQWLTGTDLVLVTWALVSICGVVFNMIPGITKHLGSMALVYIFEGSILVALACLPFAQFQSFRQVAVVLLAFECLFRFSFGLWRASRDLSIAPRVLFGALGRVFGVAALLLGVAVLLRIATAQWSPVSQVAVNGLVYSLIAFPAVYYLGLPTDPRQRILQAVLRRLGRV